MLLTAVVLQQGELCSCCNVARVCLQVGSTAKTPVSTTTHITITRISCCCAVLPVLCCVPYFNPQISNNCGMLHYTSGGQFKVPVVIRGPGGVGRQLGAEHSQRLESYFQSIPGVQLVAVSTVANAKALLKSVSVWEEDIGV